MKRMSIEEIVLQIIFFIAGIYILFRIFIPIINPASMAINSNYNGESFYTRILNNANESIEVTAQNNEGSTTGIIPVLFTYLTGIDLTNPKTYLASQLLMLHFIDSTIIDAQDQAPIVVIPRKIDSNPSISKSRTPSIPQKSTSSAIASNKGATTKKNNPGTVSAIKPKEVKITKKKLVTSKPTVLIFHTHTTEAYNPDKLKDKNFSIDNFSKTVVKVGDALNHELETQYGISVIHDSTIHDIPLRSTAYGKSRPTVQKYIKKYPNLKLIIDLHRDGEVKKNLYTAIINKEKYARVMFVAGIKFDKHEKNNKTTQKLESTFDYLYPGFSRGIDYKNSIYNQDLNPNMVLLEVGTNENSIEEAVNSTKVIAKVIAKYLK